MWWKIWETSIIILHNCLQFSQHHLLKSLPFHQWEGFFFFDSLLESYGCSCLCLYLSLSMYVFICKNYAMLPTTALRYNLKQAFNSFIIITTLIIIYIGYIIENNLHIEFNSFNSHCHWKIQKKILKYKWNHRILNIAKVKFPQSMAECLRVVVIQLCRSCLNNRSD